MEKEKIGADALLTYKYIKSRLADLYNLLNSPYTTKGKIMKDIEYYEREKRLLEQKYIIE